MRISRSVADKAVELYASELFARTNAAGTVDAVDEQLRALVGAVRGHSELRWALTDPGVPNDTKHAVLTGLFGGSGDETLISLVMLMTEMDHLELIRDLSRAFTAMSERERGIVAVEVTTAVELTDDLRETISKKLSAEIGKPVALRERVDAAILGGIVINQAGRVLDGSVAAQLDRARLVLSTAKTGGEA